MKKGFSTIVFMMLLVGNIFSQGQMTLAEFKGLCDSVGMQFTMPEGYHVVDVKENPDLFYAFAIANADSSMEIRYSIMSMKAYFKEYEESLKNPDKTMADPNKWYIGIMQANVLNMTGGQNHEIGSFPPQAVKKEFNADAGGSCFFEFNCVFGKGYKYGQAMYLHKDNTCDAIVTFMSQDKTSHPRLMGVGFHALTFK